MDVSCVESVVIRDPIFVIVNKHEGIYYQVPPYVDAGLVALFHERAAPTPKINESDPTSLDKNVRVRGGVPERSIPFLCEECVLGWAGNGNRASLSERFYVVCRRRLSSSSVVVGRLSSPPSPSFGTWTGPIDAE